MLNIIDYSNTDYRYVSENSKIRKYTNFDYYDMMGQWGQRQISCVKNVEKYMSYPFFYSDTYEGMKLADKLRWDKGYRPVKLDCKALLEEVRKFFSEAMNGVHLRYNDTADLTSPMFVSMGYNEHGFVPIEKGLGGYIITFEHGAFADTAILVLKHAGFVVDTKNATISL